MSSFWGCLFRPCSVGLKLLILGSIQGMPFLRVMNCIFWGHTSGLMRFLQIKYDPWALLYCQHVLEAQKTILKITKYRPLYISHSSSRTKPFLKYCLLQPFQHHCLLSCVLTWWPSFLRTLLSERSLFSFPRVP